MLCTHCGAWIDDDSVFCESCGSRVLPEGNNEETQDLGTFLKQENDRSIRDLDELMSFDEPSEPEPLGLDRTLVFHKPEATIEEEPEFQEEEPASAETEVVEEPEIITESAESTEPKDEIQEEEPELSEKPEEILQEFITTELLQEPEHVEYTELLTEPETDSEEEELLDAKPEDAALQQPAPEPYEDWEAPEEKEYIAPLYCMSCGKKLPEGAAFCDACGTLTGEVAPTEIRRRRAKQSIVMPLLKGYFPAPAETIQLAAEEDSFSVGVGIYGVKAVLLAVVAAIFSKPLIAVLGSSWFTAGDTFGFAAKVFLTSLVTDALLVGLLYGASILMKTAGSVRNLTGACGLANLLPSVIWVITLILAANAPKAALCGALIAMAASVVLTSKAAEAVCEVKESRSMYMSMAVAAVYIVILYLFVTVLI